MSSLSVSHRFVVTRQISKLSSSKPFNITAIELAAPVVERDGDAGAYVNAGLEQQRTHAFRWRGQRLLRLQDGTQRGYRAAKDRHHGIADGLDERSVLFGDDLAQHVEMAHHATKGGGVAEFQTTQTIAPRLQRQRQLALLARRDQLLATMCGVTCGPPTQYSRASTMRSAELGRKVNSTV